MLDHSQELKSQSKHCKLKQNAKHFIPLFLKYDGNWSMRARFWCKGESFSPNQTCEFFHVDIHCTSRLRHSKTAKVLQDISFSLGRGGGGVGSRIN